MRITGFSMQPMTRYTELMHEKLLDEGSEMWQVEEKEIEQTGLAMVRPDLREFACIPSHETQESALLGEQGLMASPQIEQMF